MAPRHRFNFSRSVNMMQKVRRYSWQDIETDSANILSPGRLDAQEEAGERQAKLTQIVKRLHDSFTTGRPYDMDGPLEFLNSDFIVFLYMKDCSRGLDALVSRLRQDAMHKLDFALMRLQTGFLSNAEYGTVPIAMQSLEFLTKCAIWRNYEKDSEDGHDYDLKKSLLRRKVPVPLVNRLFFCQSADDSLSASLSSRYHYRF